MAERPQFRMPLEFIGGEFAVVEQDTVEEIEQCVDTITRYQKGARLTRPQFGISDPTFAMIDAGGFDASDIVASVLEWETRAETVLVEQSSASVVDAIMGVALRLRLTEGGA